MEMEFLLELASLRKAWYCYDVSLLSPIVYLFLCSKEVKALTEETMKNAVFWDIVLCDSCKNRPSSETSVLTRATRRSILEDGIFHSHHRENLKFTEGILSIYGILYCTDIIRRLMLLKLKFHFMFFYIYTIYIYTIYKSSVTE
jgi:hypothetical protein